MASLFDKIRSYFQPAVNQVASRFQLPGQQKSQPIKVGSSNFRQTAQRVFQPNQWVQPQQVQRAVQPIIRAVQPYAKPVIANYQNFQKAGNQFLTKNVNQIKSATKEFGSELLMPTKTITPSLSGDPSARQIAQAFRASPIGGVAKLPGILSKAPQLIQGLSQFGKETQGYANVYDYYKDSPESQAYITAFGFTRPASAAKLFSKSQLKYIAKNFDVETRNIMGQVATMLDKNPKATFAQLGSLGQTFRTIAKDVFGSKKMSKLSPRQIMNYIDAGMQQSGVAGGIRQLGFIPKNYNTLNIGLQSQNLRQSPSVVEGVSGGNGIPKVTIPPTANIPGKSGILKGAYNRVVSAVENVLRKQGKSGGELATRIRQARELSERGAGENVYQIKQVLKGLTDDEIKIFSDVVEGKVTTTSKNLLNAVSKWQSISDDVAKKAQEFGLTIKNPKTGVEMPFQPRKNFFPHFVPEDIIANAKSKKAALQKLVDSGWAKSMAEAETKFEQYLSRVVKRRYGNLEFARDIDIPLYEKDPRKALIKYIEGAYGRLADTQMFGANDDVAYKLVDQIAKEGGDAEFARKAIDTVLGKLPVDEFTNKITKGLTGFQTITKLGLAAPMNLSQNTSTAMATRADIMIKQLVKSFKGTSRQAQQEFAERAGVILNNSMDDFLKQIGGDQKITSKFLRKVGFTLSEKYNRVIAANAGKEHLISLVNRFVKNPKNQNLRRAIEYLGVNPDKILKQGMATIDDQITAARHIVESTQFKTDAFDLPLAASSPWGKVWTQFKSFAYKQTKFLGQHSKRVGQEAMKGNFAPLTNTLITMGLVSPVIGEVVRDVRAMLSNKKRTDEGLERYLNNVFTAVSLGLMSDVGTLITGKYGPGGFIGTLGGPTASDAYKGKEAISSLLKDRKTFTGAKEFKARTKPLGKFIAGEVPVIGPALKNTFFENQYTESLIGANAPSEFEQQVRQKEKAIKLYAEGKQENNQKKIQEALDLKKKYGFKIAAKEVEATIKDVARPNVDSAVEKYLDGDIEGAKAIKEKYNIKISQDDMERVAKRKAIQLYLEFNNNKNNQALQEALKLKADYGLKITQKDIEAQVSDVKEPSAFEFLGF